MTRALAVASMLLAPLACGRGFQRLNAPASCVVGAEQVCSCAGGAIGNQVCAGGALFSACDCTQAGIVPAGATLSTSASVRFYTSVSNSADPSGTWSVDESGGGAITADGLYTAPALAGVYHVRWTANAGNGHTASALATVVDAPVPADIVVVAKSFLASKGLSAAVGTPQAGAFYDWSILNGVITGSSRGNEITWDAPTAGTFALLIVTTTNAAGDRSAASNALVELLPVPAALSIATARATYPGIARVVARVADPVDGLSYQWTVSGAGTLLASPTGPVASFAPGPSGVVSLRCDAFLDPSAPPLQTATRDVPIRTDLAAVELLGGAPGGLGHLDGAPGTYRLGNFGAAMLATSPSTTIYFADTYYTIRKLAPDGSVTTVAGVAGMSGSLDGPVSQALFGTPSAMALAPSGDLYVAEHCGIRHIDAAGQVSTPFGAVHGCGTDGGLLGASGPSGLTFSPIVALALDMATPDPTLWVATTGVPGASPLVQVPTAVAATGAVSVYGSGGAKACTGSTLGTVKLDLIKSLLADATNLYVASHATLSIARAIPWAAASAATPAPIVAGSCSGANLNASFEWPILPGHVGLFSIFGQVRWAETATPPWVVGNNEALIDGPGDQAAFDDPTAFASADSAGDDLYFGDQAASPPVVALRQAHNLAGASTAADVTVSTLARSVAVTGDVDGPGADARFVQPTQVVVDADDRTALFDAGTGKLKRIVDGQVSTLAGIGGSGLRDGPGNRAQFVGILAMAAWRNRAVLVLDDNGSVIRQVADDGTVSHFAGAFISCGDADGPAATACFLGTALASNGLDTVYVAEAGGLRVIRDDQVQTLASGATTGHQDLGPLSSFDLVTGIAFAPPSTLYVTENRHVRRVRDDPTGVVVDTLIGASGPTGLLQDGPCTSAVTVAPTSPVVEPNGNVLFLESGAIRRIVLQGLPGGCSVETVIPAWGRPFGVSPATSGLNTPLSLAASPGGDYAMIDQNESVVLRFRPALLP